MVSLRRRGGGGGDREEKREGWETGRQTIKGQSVPNQRVWRVHAQYRNAFNNVRTWKEEEGVSTLEANKGFEALPEHDALSSCRKGSPAARAPHQRGPIRYARRRAARGQGRGATCTTEARRVWRAGDRGGRRDRRVSAPAASQDASRVKGSGASSLPTSGEVNCPLSQSLQFDRYSNFPLGRRGGGGLRPFPESASIEAGLCV